MKRFIDLIVEWSFLIWALVAMWTDHWDVGTFAMSLFIAWNVLEMKAVFQKEAFLRRRAERQSFDIIHKDFWDRGMAKILEEGSAGRATDLD